MVTWKDIAAYRQRFQAKISSNVVISTQARMSRVTDNVLIQLCNRLVCRESHLASLQEAQDHFESLPHDEFFTLVLDLYRDADRILSPESHIETKIKSLPLKLSLTDLPIKNLTAELAANSLIQIIGRYGIPKEILTDNGTQFANSIFEELPTIIDFSHQKIQAYSHEENSIVERANKEIMRHLRDIIFDTRIYADWYKYLPFVQRIKNSEIHSSTGVSPANLMFGPNIDLNRGILTEYKVPPSNISKYIADNILHQNLAIKVAQETQFKTTTTRIDTDLFKKENTQRQNLI